MTDAERTSPDGQHCPVCGAELVTGTADFADTPAESTEVDHARVELNPGQMVQSTICPTSGCPGPDTGAVV
jgi:hypothetical protein